MQNDFDYMQMLKGELYIAQDIHESNGCTTRRKNASR